MTEILQILPVLGATDAEAIISAAQAALMLPFSLDQAKAFCAGLSEKLLNDPRTKAFPELQALGFWLRPSSVESMVADHLQGQTAAGIIFQIPPSNVDALFGYTLAIALLCGNASITRLPRAVRPAQNLFLRILEEKLLQAPPAVRERVILISYNHNDAITSRLSSNCEVRLVWGSDATIEHINLLPLSPSAREISFGDRFSSAAIHASNYLGQTEVQRDAIVQKFFNDMYGFDQLACSSPRLLAWVGADALTASADFYPRLAAYAAKRGYDPGLGGNIAKLKLTYLALHDLRPQSYKVYTPQLSVITLDNLASLAPFKSVNYGYGMLIETHLKHLVDLAATAEACDQTLTHWGFDDAQIQEFTSRSAGRGYSRIVPVGQALSFDAVWEGINLFHAMTSRKSVAA